MRIEDCKPGMRLWTRDDHNCRVFQVEVIGENASDKRTVFCRNDDGKIQSYWPNTLWADESECRISAKEHADWNIKYHRSRMEEYEAAALSLVAQPVIITDDDDEGEDTALYEIQPIESFDDTGYGSYSEALSTEPQCV